MHKVRLHLALAALLAPPVLAAALAPSSHREAPFVTENPKVDATDFYMFTSYEPGREDHVVFVANYLPLQDAYGGPNYFKMDPTARYNIHIDNDGDAIEDISFQFRFWNPLNDIKIPVGNPGQEVEVSVPLRVVGPVLPGDESTVNDPERYGVNVVRGPIDGSGNSTRVRNGADGSPLFTKPLDNIGSKTIPNYEAYASDFVYDIDLPGGQTGRMFVGQRKESFVVNLGETFDLINLDPVGPPDAKENTLEGKNVTSFILEVPKTFLVDQGPSIGAWTTASLPRTRKLLEDPTFEGPTEVFGGHRQVSRLGMPLVNEVVIGLPDKNRFNSSRPLDDGQFIDYVTNPTLPELIEILFGVQAPDLFPRADLTATFLTGFSGLNDTGGIGEMLRLNTDTPPTPLTLQKNLGLLDGDVAGFPNGRRPGDDVVDITLRVAMGAILDPSFAPDGQLPYTDGAAVDATDFDAIFPFLRTPVAGSPQQ